MSGRVGFDLMTRSKFVCNFETAFHTATGLPLNLVPCDPQGEFAARAMDENPLCSLIRQTPTGRQTCQIQAEIRQHFAKKLAPIHVRCWSGLVKAAVPVLVGGEHVATLLAGPAFVQKPSRRDLDHIANQLNRWGVASDLPSVEKTCAGTPMVSEPQLEAVLELLSYFAQQLGECANRWLLARHDGEPACVASAKNFVQAHVAEPLHMRDAAHSAHLSPCYFCKSFKKGTGITFTEYVARVRVEKAKTLLLDRSLRINEAGYTAGFQSLPYFDRVFKRYAGMTPKEFRAAQQL